MFPIYGSNSEFTYDKLSEVRLDPFWTSLASIVTAAFVVVVALAASGQPPVQAEIQSVDAAFVATVESDGPEAVVVAP
jgi:hypothetical protein